MMTNYDSFSHCHFADIFFAIHVVVKELKISEGDRLNSGDCLVSATDSLQSN